MVQSYEKKGHDKRKRFFFMLIHEPYAAEREASWQVSRGIVDRNPKYAIPLPLYSLVSHPPTYPTRSGLPTVYPHGSPPTELMSAFPLTTKAIADHYMSHP